MSNAQAIQSSVATIHTALVESEATELVLAALEHCDDERSAADLAVKFGLDGAIGRDAAVTTIRTIQGLQ